MGSWTKSVCVGIEGPNSTEAAGDWALGGKGMGSNVETCPVSL